MLDKFVIFNRGGLVLWSYETVKIHGNPVNDMIKSMLLEERTSSTSTIQDSYTLKWTLANDFDLVFVAVYQKFLQLMYVDELLRLVREKFTQEFGDAVLSKEREFQFKETFLSILRECEAKFSRSKQKLKEPKIPDKILKKKKKQKKEDENKQEANEGKITAETNVNNIEGEEADEKKLKGDKKAEKLRMKVAAAGRGKSKRSGRKPTSIFGNLLGSKENDSSPKPKAKQNRTWDSAPLSASEAEKLDLSEKPTDAARERLLDAEKERYLSGEKEVDLDKEWVDESDSEEEEEEEEQEEEEVQSQGNSKTTSNDGKSKKSGWGVFNFFKKLTGNKVLDEEDLEPVLNDLRSKLMEKNVASEISHKLCDSVRTNLVGKKLTSFTSIKKFVKQAMEEALVRILTPKRKIDIMRDIEVARKQHRPYTMVFVGVNGVGKSTNLAKVCFWLKQNNMKCMIAACDTFRSGAVEQLGVHSECLEVPLFHRGYGKDAAGIAAEAIKKAKDEAFDVVLIDTAGRMQDNEPLMRALAKLINVNKPDLVLFVGEALVGNDGVDQLKKFNQSLADLSSADSPCGIDGILLTKFDTIDEKVGAALSMVYSTGQPIVFVGIGQKYTHLRRLNVGTIVKALLK